MIPAGRASTPRGLSVLQLGPFPPPHGGVQTNLAAIRDYARRQGIGCAVINLNRFVRPVFDEVYFPRSALGVVRLLLRVPADVLHVHHGGTVTPRLLGLWLLCTLLPGKRTVITFHSGGYPSSEAGRAANRRTCLAWILRRFDALIAVNAEIAAWLRRLGVVPDRIQVICPYAVDGRAGSAELPEGLARFFASHRPVLLTVGLLERHYDMELQIDALGRLREHCPDAGLVIAGAGSLEEELRERIRSKPYAAHVLMYGDMPHPITLRAIAECSVFLRTTFYDGDSVSVREALHLGTPVIATDNGMRPPGVVLLPSRNVDVLVEVIERTLAAESPRLLHPSSDRGESNLEAVLAVYRRITSRHSVPGPGRIVQRIDVAADIGPRCSLALEGAGVRKPVIPAGEIDEADGAQ